MQESHETFEMVAIGEIRRYEDGVVLEIAEPYRPALQDLAQFSHVLVFWWAEAFDTEADRARLHIQPPYAPERSIGVFATRSPFRPNPIALTTCPILAVDEAAGTVTVGDIDAYDGTPIVDLKAYLAVSDRVRTVRQAPWFDGWPAWLPESGTQLMDPRE